MADEMEDVTEAGGMLSQADLDALIAAGQSADDGSFDAEDMFEAEESELGGSAPAPSAAPATSAPSAAPAPGRSGLVDLPSFAPAAPAAPPAEGPGGLGRVRDIPLEVTVELGRTRLLIRDIMDLSAGSIIELDKIARRAGGPACQRHSGGTRRSDRD